MDIGKIINSVFNYILRETEAAVERRDKMIEDKRKELQEFSDKKMKKIYQDRDKLKYNDLRNLVEEEAMRRGLH